jgi:hypothetical protein
MTLMMVTLLDAAALNFVGDCDACTSASREECFVGELGAAIGFVTVLPEVLLLLEALLSLVSFVIIKPLVKFGLMENL